MVILLKNGCFVRHMFCTIFVPLSVAKILGKYIRGRYLVFLVKNLVNGYFYCNYFTPNFSNRYFSELFFLVGHKKINKIYHERLSALEIIHWRLRLYGNLFCIGQTLQLSQFYHVTLADLCALLINIFEQLPLINSKVNLRLPQHLK